MNTVAKLLLARGRGMKPGDPVPSPCMSICRMDASTSLCEGCFRTLDEIAAWSTLDENAKRIIWKTIEARAAA